MLTDLQFCPKCGAKYKKLDNLIESYSEGQMQWNINIKCEMECGSIILGRYKCDEWIWKQAHDVNKLELIKVTLIKECSSQNKFMDITKYSRNIDV